MPLSPSVPQDYNAQIAGATAAADLAGIPFKILDEHVEIAYGKMFVGTMHLAKRLEFRAVAVMACDDRSDPPARAHPDRDG